MRSMFVLACSYCAVLGLAQSGRSVKTPSTPPSERYGSEWQTEEWVVDDSAFVSAKRKMQKLIDSPEAAVKEWERRRRGYADNERVALSEWAYCAYRSEGSADGGQRTRMAESLEAMAKTKSPRSSEFARLRFILESKVYPGPHLVKIGDRLISEFPASSGLVNYHAWNLALSKSLTEKRRGVKYAQARKKEKPHSVREIQLCADVLGVVGISLQDATLMRESIQNYDEALKILPASQSEIRAICEVRRKAVLKALEKV